MSVASFPMSWLILERTENFAVWGVGSENRRTGQAFLLHDGGAHQGWKFARQPLPPLWNGERPFVGLVFFPSPEENGEFRRVPATLLDLITRPRFRVGTWCHYGGPLGDQLAKRWRDWRPLHPLDHAVIRTRLGERWHPQPVSRHLGLPWEQEFRETQRLIADAFASAGSGADFQAIQARLAEAWRKAVFASDRGNETSLLVHILPVAAMLARLRPQIESLKGLEPDLIRQRAERLWREMQPNRLNQILAEHDERVRPLRTRFGPICGDLYTLTGRDGKPGRPGEHIDAVLHAIERFEGAWAEWLNSLEPRRPTEIRRG